MSYDTDLLAVGTPVCRMKMDGNISCEYGQTTSGTYVGRTGIVPAMGSGQALDCDGAATNINIANASNINTSTSVRRAYSVWVKPDTLPSTRKGIYEQGGGTNWVVIYQEGTNVVFVVGEGSTAQGVATASGVLTVGVTSHIFAQFDAANLICDVYVDGVKSTGTLAAIGGSLNSHSGDVTIGNATDVRGADSASNINYFDGAVQDLVLWDEPTLATQTKISAIYSSGSAGGGTYFPPFKIMTNENLITLVNDGTFAQLATIPNTKKGVTRLEAETYIDIDTSGTIGSYANNRLVNRTVLVGAATTFESIMRSAMTNVEPSSCVTATTGMKHDGNNTLPILGDRCYTPAETVFNGENKWCSLERYPGSGDHQITRIDTNGYVTFREWCTGGVTKAPTPTGLAASNYDCDGFTLSWNGGGEYLNPSYRVFRDGGHGDVSGLINGDQNSFNVSLANGLSGTFTVRAYYNSSGTGAYNESSGLLVTNPSCSWPITMSYIPTQTTPAGACSAPDSTTYYHDGIADQIANGDRIYTNSGLTTPFNGGGKYFKDYDYNRSLLVDANGYVTSIQSC